MVCCRCGELYVVVRLVVVSAGTGPGPVRLEVMPVADVDVAGVPPEVRATVDVVGVSGLTVDDDFAGCCVDGSPGWSTAGELTAAVLVDEVSLPSDPVDPLPEQPAATQLTATPAMTQRASLVRRARGGFRPCRTAHPHHSRAAGGLVSACAAVVITNACGHTSTYRAASKSSPRQLSVVFVSMLLTGRSSPR